MPYITQEEREDLAPVLDPLLDLARTLSKGEVNYIVTKIIVSKYGRGGYDQRSEGASVLQDAHDEFYRRVVAPYEDMKKEANGDVY
jgi:hypothetical protein